MKYVTYQEKSTARAAKVIIRGWAASSDHFARAKESRLFRARSHALRNGDARLSADRGGPLHHSLHVHAPERSLFRVGVA